MTTWKWALSATNSNYCFHQLLYLSCKSCKQSKKRQEKDTPFSYTGIQEVDWLRKKKPQTLQHFFCHKANINKHLAWSFLFSLGFGLVCFLLVFRITQAFVINIETKHSKKPWQLWKIQHSIEPEKKNDTICNNMYFLIELSPNVL